MNTYDYYSEAKILAEQLEKAGFPDYGAAILGAMEEGETGTEIFMLMRARLDLISNEKALPPELLKFVMVLHGKLSDALT